ncbi:hypothetical protein Tco_0196247 [Tanacetum coccineum]
MISKHYLVNAEDAFTQSYINTHSHQRGIPSLTPPLTSLLSNFKIHQIEDITMCNQLLLLSQGIPEMNAVGVGCCGQREFIGKNFQGDRITAVKLGLLLKH